MEGKRIPQPETGEEAKKKLPIAGIIAAVLAALVLEVWQMPPPMESTVSPLI